MHKRKGRLRPALHVCAPAASGLDWRRKCLDPCCHARLIHRRISAPVRTRSWRPAGVSRFETLGRIRLRWSARPWPHDAGAVVRRAVVPLCHRSAVPLSRCPTVSSFRRPTVPLLSHCPSCPTVPCARAGRRGPPDRDDCRFTPLRRRWIFWRGGTERPPVGHARNGGNTRNSRNTRNARNVRNAWNARNGPECRNAGTGGMAGTG